jgi:hypothetical protein
VIIIARIDGTQRAQGGRKTVTRPGYNSNRTGNHKEVTMNTPSPAMTATPQVQSWKTRPRDFTLRPVSPALPATLALPQHFTVQISAQAYLRQRLPLGLNGPEAVAYVKAFARSRQRDCRIDYPGGGALYLLSDGGQFQVPG